MMMMLILYKPRYVIFENKNIKKIVIHMLVRYRQLFHKDKTILLNVIPFILIVT